MSKLLVLRSFSLHVLFSAEILRFSEAGRFISNKTASPVMSYTWVSRPFLSGSFYFAMACYGTGSTCIPASWVVSIHVAIVLRVAQGR